MDPGKDVVMEKVIPTNLKLDIMMLTNTMQNQNGVKLNDYLRYSNYCKKKINKIRKLYKITQGKKKYIKIQITPEMITDSKMLLICILDIERRWAQGMHCKQTLTNVGQDIKLLRYNIKRKFRKSAAEALNFVKICKVVCDSDTVLEAEAYYSILEANYKIFKMEFSESLNLLKTASEIYTKLSKSKDAIESIAYKEKVNSLKTLIRLCQYNLKKNIKDYIFEEEALEKEEENIVESNKPKDKKAYEINYHSFSIPIKNEKVKNGFQKIEEISAKLENETDLNKKINPFTDIFNIVDDILKISKKERADEVNPSENITKIYNKLNLYIQNLRLTKYIEKNLIYIEEYSKYFNTKLILEIFEKKNIKLKNKPQEMIKLYSNLTDYLNQQLVLEKENPDQTYLLELNYKIQVYSVYKNFFIGLFYLTHKKLEELYTIMHHVQEGLEEAKKYYTNNKLKQNNSTSLNRCSEQATNIKSLIEFVLAQTFVRMSEENKLKQSNVNMELDGNNKKDLKQHIKCHSWLYDTLTNQRNVINEESFNMFKDYVNLPYGDYKEAIEKQNFNNSINIIQFPPTIQTMYPKPIIYDLTFQNIVYPDIEAKTKKEEKAGLLGRTFGYFFSGK